MSLFCLGQKKCDCDLDDIETGDEGKYTDYLDKESLSHPLTTFYRKGKNSYYNDSYNQTQLKNSLRSLLKKAYDNDNRVDPQPRQSFATLYKSVYGYADRFTSGYSGTQPLDLATPSEYKAQVSHFNENANVAKLCAFVALAGIDGDGGGLSNTRIDEFRDVAVDAIELLTDEDYALVYYATTLKYWSQHHKIGQSIISFLQAYDYLMAFDGGNPDVKNCGLFISCLVRNFYRGARGGIIGGALFRNDNHSLTVAAVVGLASVVLHDHGTDRWSDTWKPETWAHAALWRSSRTMWNNKWGKKVESKRSPVGKNEIWGFGEGPHYYAYSFQLMNPYILALKNARGGRTLPIPGKGWEDQYKYKPDHTYTRLYKREEVQVNLWDDEDYRRVNEWFCSLIAPDGTLSIIDDTWGTQRTNCAVIMRDDNLPYFNNTTAQRTDQFEPHTNYFGYSIDLRPDVLAALAEGYYNSIDNNATKARAFESGDIVIHDPVTAEQEQSRPQYAKQLYFHLNGENNDLTGNYEGGEGHEHEDLSSFILHGGGHDLSEPLNNDFHPQVLVYEQGMMKDGDKVISKGPTSHNMVFCTSNNNFGENNIKYNKLSGLNFKKAADVKLIEGADVITASVTGAYKGESKLTMTRTVERFNEGGLPNYTITDVIRCDGDEVHNTIGKRRFFWTMIGNGLESDQTFNESGGIFEWSGNCDGTRTETMKLTATVDVLMDGGGTELTFTDDVQVGNKYQDDPLNYATKTRLFRGGENSDQITFVTHLTPSYCVPLQIAPPNPIKKHNIPGQAVAAMVIGLLDKKTATINQLTVGPYSLSDPFLNGNYDSLVINGKSARFTIDTSIIYTGSDPCIINTPFKELTLQWGSSVKLDTNVYVDANDTLEFLNYRYDRLYYYEGAVTTTSDSDTVCFYLPQIPDPQYSLMAETTGIPYEYDTLNQTMCLSFLTAGTYNFRFEPTDACYLSCFFPRDSIIDTFYFHNGSYEYLGHKLEILRDSGWLDINKGSKMVICSKAVLDNHDSLTIQSGSAIDTSYGYGQGYRTTEDARYREDFKIGSGASLYQGFGRSMIIVQDEGALVLKDSSQTTVGCGGTILIKAGGTLKIENGARLTIGGECGGYGEIIAEDSAFVCIEDSAYMEFFKSKIDTSDRHIFFISKNPKSPAISGVADSACVPQSVYCIDFCDLKDSFPTHGIANHPHGWFNVGKPAAWFWADSIVCYGQDVILNGIPTLNETRYRFTVCEYDKIAEMCIGSTSYYPLNNLDTFYGGRLSTFNISDTAQMLWNKSYKITLTVRNDCDDQSSFSRVVTLPAALVANVDGDTVMCGGKGVVSAHGLNSLGIIDSVRWEVWECVPKPDLDSAAYIVGADTYYIEIDSFWSDSLTLDSVQTDTIWYYTTDTIDSDSVRNAAYYQNYYDTTIIDNEADTISFDSVCFDPGKKYKVVMSLYNGCGRSVDTLIVRMRPGPNVDAGPDKYMAASHPSVTNSDPELEGVVTGHSGSHTWSPTTNLTPSTSLTPVANPSSTTTYTLSATDVHGCTNTDEVTVFKNTFANAGADTTICYDDSAKVGIPSQLGYIYEWFPSDAVSDDAIAEPYAYVNSATSTTIIKVKVTDDLMNVEWDDIVIAKDSTIEPLFDQSGGPPYNATLTITETRVLNENLTWNFGDGSPTATGQNVGHAYPPVPNGMYNSCVYYINACGTVQWCDTVKFDPLGNHIPTPPEPASLEKATDIQLISLSASPNPFRNETALIYSLGGIDYAVLYIYDMRGQMLEKLPLSGNEGTQILNLTSYPAGVYTAHLLINGHSAEQQKLVIMR